MPPCLIQVEYFHVNTKGQLEAIWRESLARTMETLPDMLSGLTDLGPGIKTCLRFHDMKSGMITRLALDIEELEKQIEETALRMIGPDTGWLRRELYRWRCRRLDFALHAHMKVLELVLRRHLSETLLAIEKIDRHYRLVQDNEKHELLIKIKKTSSFWLFVFTPNDLLSEQNELVTAIM